MSILTLDFNPNTFYYTVDGVINKLNIQIYNWYNLVT